MHLIVYSYDQSSLQDGAILRERVSIFQYICINFTCLISILWKLPILFLDCFQRKKFTGNVSLKETTYSKYPFALYCLLFKFLTNQHQKNISCGYWEKHHCFPIMLMVKQSISFENHQKVVKSQPQKYIFWCLGTTSFFSLISSASFVGYNCFQLQEAE